MKKILVVLACLFILYSCNKAAEATTTTVAADTTTTVAADTTTTVAPATK